MVAAALVLALNLLLLLQTVGVPISLLSVGNPCDEGGMAIPPEIHAARRAAGRADPGAAVRQGAHGTVRRAAGGLCRADLRPADERRRGTAHRHRPPARGVACHGDQDDRPAETRGAGVRQAVSRRVPDRGRRTTGRTRASAAPHGGRLLLAVGVPAEAAEQDAEGIEHHVSDTRLAAFGRFLARE